jgi:WD40 repeat protein
MAEQTVEPSALVGGKPAEYDAFLSYAHRDRQVTTAIQKGLHQIGRPLGRLRALRVFRDDTNLTASPDLWGRITDGLDRSRYMIAVLSPQSAASHWVNEEISYWLAHRGPEQLMLVLAEGHLQWDATGGRFDPQHSDAAPPVLTAPGSLRSEPLYIDVSDDAPWDLGSLVFRDKVTSLAAPIHGKPKDQLAGDDLREQRRFRRLRAAAISGLVVLTVVAVVAALIAVAKQREANSRLRDAVVAKLNAEGASMLARTTPGTDTRALQELLAANAIQANGLPILDAQIARFTTQKIIDTSTNVFDVAYSPDGRRIATAQIDGTVRQWDSASGKPIGAPITTRNGGAQQVAYTPDGHTIASAGSDGMLLLNADTGAVINSHSQRVGHLRAIAVSPDGNLVFTGSAGGELQLWDAHSGQLRTAIKVFDHPDASINDMAVGRGGDLVAVSTDKGDVAIYDTKTLQPQGPNIEITRDSGTRTGCFQIAFNPDGRTLAVGTEDLQLWDVDTHTLVRRIRLGTTNFGTWAMAIAFSPAGQLAAGRQDGAVQLWDPGTGTQIGRTLIGHAGMVQGVAFSPNGRQIATTSVDGTLRLWSATVGQVMRGTGEHLFDAAFSPDGALVGAFGDNTIEQWDVRTGERLPPIQLNIGAFTYLDGHRIVAATGDSAQVLDARTGQPVRPPVHLELSPDSSTFAVSGDGRMVATGLHDGSIDLYDVATGNRVGKNMKPEGAKRLLQGLAFTPDGHDLVGGYDDGLRLWNTATTQQDGPVLQDKADPSKPVMSVAVSRDGKTLAGGGLDGIMIWDRTTRTQRPHSPMRGPNGLIFTVAFGVGPQLASGGVDATLRLWDTATGQATAAPEPQSETVLGAAISPDGRLVAAANADGTLLLSPAVADPAQLCDKLSANMSHKQWRQWVSPGVGYIAVCPGLPIAAD